MTIDNGVTTVSIMADVDVEVTNLSMVCSADLVQRAVLQACAHKARLPQGKYNIRLLAVITSETE
jgi:hypothetical protein